ncbi:ATP-binding protein [Caproiciproducens galactitolivorans]|uniref:ATP-binding protein n=1 Tax=Caproiciproducens galactitolivorans TaxID=642589 RepID=UPI001FAAD97A|nr:ATP-binding protein [Caproiciproducens galactitolivorans]
MIALGYSREIYESAERILAERRKTAENAAAERKSIFYSCYPEAKKIESALSKTAIAAARAIFGGGNAKEQLTKLKQENQMLQNQMNELLASAGHNSDYLEPPYVCKKCSDTGYIDGRMCSCMKKLLRAQAYENLNKLTPLSLSTFESFSLDYYPDIAENGRESPRRIMEKVFYNCQNYARNFSLSSPSLIMQGGTGLGKTHMSLAIANTAIKKGFGVVYCSVNNIITQLEHEHFGRDAQGDTDRLLLECDLLILDDLGTEFRSAFSCAEIYNIVNTRLMTQKPTIISTNLSLQELQERYTERFASRIMGDYVRVLFCGKDNRLQKRLRNQT